MRLFITLLLLAGMMTACKNVPQEPIGAVANTAISEAKAAEFAEFEAWKQQKENIALKAQTEPLKETKTTIVYVPQPTRAVTKTVQAQPVSTIAETPVPQQQEVKKKWSKAAKGAVIGAGVGAAAGAIISKKNRALGAIIGGVAGGGVGYGIGRGLDKRDAKNNLVYTAGY